MRRSTLHPGRERGLRSVRGGRSLVGIGTAFALVFGVAACSEPEPAPTSIPIPTVTDSGTGTGTDSGEWGTYGDKANACFGVAGDVLSLALVPNNLSLADPESGVSAIDDAIRTSGDAAPAAIAAHYRQMSALVRSYGIELSAWSAAVKARATSAPTPSASATTTSAPSPGAAIGNPLREVQETSAPLGLPSGTPDPSPSDDTLTRPDFDSTAFAAQLDHVKTWLSETCG